MKRAIYSAAFLLMLLAAFFLGRHGTRSQPARTTDAFSPRILYYVDPMHPSYKSDTPGIAPDCGMKLVPVYADTVDPNLGDHPAGTVTINADQQQLIGLRTAPVEKAAGAEQLRVLGKVAVDDARVYRINSGVDGWLRQTMDGSVGSHVRKDQTLATFYSPEFVALEQGYLVATERMSGSTKQQAAPGTQSTAARLRNFGMGERQIAEIAATRQMPENVDITAPADGFIIARNVTAGQRFDKGMELYRLADLSRVWILADVVESEAAYFRPGMTATVNIPGQNRKFQARISGALPQFDPVTRTMKVRLEMNNPGYLLRPEMFVDLELPMKVPAGLSIPMEALIDAGAEQRVYVDKGQGTFEPRKVMAGFRFGDRVQVLKGLKEGERVVVAGNFLVDSESRLKNTSSSRGSGIIYPAEETNFHPSRGADARMDGNSTTMAQADKAAFETEPDKYPQSGGQP